VISASVVVCTRNRAKTLARFLDALEQDDVADGLEVVVVDNGSSDDTPAVVHRKVRDSRLRLVYVQEPVRGKANALNTGVAAARGEVLLFTDDDVLVGAGWIATHLDAYADAKVAAVQGRTIVDTPQELPDWFESIHLQLLAGVDHGPSDLFPWDGYLVGSNMSARRTTFDTVGPFNRHLGPGRTGFWEDTEWSWRLQHAGLAQMYSARAVVRHAIDNNRTSAAALRKGARHNGTSACVASFTASFPFPTRASLWRLPLLAATALRQRIGTKGSMCDKACVDTQWEIGAALGRFRAAEAYRDLRKLFG
jgi:GT2 family glycosyltransferase